MRTRRFGMHLVLACLLLTLVAGMVGACAKEAPAPSPSQAPTQAKSPSPTSVPTPAISPTTAPAPATTSAPATSPAKVYELIANDHDPPTTPPGMSTAYWAKTLEERSGGRIKINLFSSGSLLKGEEAFRGLQNGIADVALYVVNRREGFLLNDVMSLPFMGWPEMKKTHQIYAELLNEFPAMVNEWKGMIIIAGPKMMFPNHLHTTKKEIKVPADIKGMKIMATGITAETVAALGGVPVDIGIADIYMSLDRGLLDGVLNHFAVIDTFGALEKVPYHTVFGDGGMSMNPVMLIMNPDVLHRLPADLQKIVLDCNSVWVNKFYELGDAQLANVYKKANEWGQTFDNLTPQEIKAWYDIVREPVHNKWMRDVEGRGLPGKVVYDRTLELIEEYSAK